MTSFQDLNISKQLQYAIDDLKFENPTPIQAESYPVILSGKDMVGIAQTGTGKTLAFMLPVLQDLKFSNQVSPRIMVLVPTRELVLQVVENIESFAKYMNIRVLGVYGGTNINTQSQLVRQGCDIIVATPGRLYDLALANVLSLKTIKKLIIDEVDVMLDLGFRFQLSNIFELMPEKRQNIMFSATMTDEISALIEDFFTVPTTVSIAVSGIPLENIAQSCYTVENYYTKVNLLMKLLKDKTTYSKVLLFVESKKSADRMYERMEAALGTELCVIHSNKSQNYRIRSIEQFDSGKNRIMIATDVMARGMDLDKISHVINFDTPNYPENYMHRIGRTGRAHEKGNSILLSTEKEMEYKQQIEKIMGIKIPEIPFPVDVEVTSELTPEERPRAKELNLGKKIVRDETNSGFHEKKEKNLKENKGGSYREKLAKKYKKPQRRGDKIQNSKARKKR